MLWEPAQCPSSESCNDCGSNAGELSFEARSRLAVFLNALSCIEKVKRLPGIDRFAMPSFRILNFIILSESESTESLLRAPLNLMNEKLFTVSLTVSLFLSVPWIPKHSIPFHPQVLAKVNRYPGHSAKCCVFGFGPTKCCFCCEPWQWHRQDPRFFSICQAVLIGIGFYCGKCFDEGPQSFALGIPRPLCLVQLGLPWWRCCWRVLAFGLWFGALLLHV